jgi:hypothetical protein
VGFTTSDWLQGDPERVGVIILILQGSRCLDPTTSGPLSGKSWARYERNDQTATIRSSTLEKSDANEVIRTLFDSADLACCTKEKGQHRLRCWPLQAVRPFYLESLCLRLNVASARSATAFIFARISGVADAAAIRTCDRKRAHFFFRYASSNACRFFTYASCSFFSLTLRASIFRFALFFTAITISSWLVNCNRWRRWRLGASVVASEAPGVVVMLLKRATNRAEAPAALLF